MNDSELGVDSPVQGGLPLQGVHGDVLLDQAVQEDGERGEADVVQRQIGSVVQRLWRVRDGIEHSNSYGT